MYYKEDYVIVQVRNIENERTSKEKQEQQKYLEMSYEKYKLKITDGNKTKNNKLCIQYE